jgi:O-antigen ligase
LFAILALWCLAHQPSRLLLLARPTVIAVLLWFALSAVTSWEPELSFRRLTFTLIAIATAAVTALLPRNVRQFAGILATVALIVLALCYFGVVFLPSLAIHQPTDFLETDLAGNWRGVFGHKNEAGAVMANFVFIGLFVARARNAALGAAIVLLSVVFLLFAQSKTSIALLPMILVLSATLNWIRSRAAGLAITVIGLTALNALAIGSLFFEPVRNLLNSVMADATFTGRTEVWQFVLDHIKERPLLGYGFAAFWGTPHVVFGMGETDVWANTAGHAHNGYLDLALTIGLPGTALVVLWLVTLPVSDFYRWRATADAGGPAAALALLFLRICLFAAFGSCFESMLLPEGAAGLSLFLAAFGLRFLSVSRVKE